MAILQDEDHHRSKFATQIQAGLPKGHVQRYRDPDGLRVAIPHSDRLIGLPRSPFVGELCYADIVSLLRRQSRWLSRAERLIIEDLKAYLEFKITTIPAKSCLRSLRKSQPPTITTSI